MGNKRIFIIAGPNGAGKTTFATEYLPKEAGCPVFVNADLIARGLSPFQPELAAIRSGRIMLEQVRTHAERGESFAFETTLSPGLCGNDPALAGNGVPGKTVFLAVGVARNRNC